MVEFQSLRARMVEQQLQRRGIHSAQVLRVMGEVPRELFVPEEWQGAAYNDRPIEIGFGQTISQPYMAALMTQALDVEPLDRILEVGTGSGYQAALLAKLGKAVFTIERHPELVFRAQNAWERLELTNIHVRIGDGTLGWPEEAPFDKIIVTAAAPAVPPALKEQLCDNGRLVIPVGSRTTQQLKRYTRRGGDFEEETLVNCVFVPLLGEEGWPEAEYGHGE